MRTATLPIISDISNILECYYNKEEKQYELLLSSHSAWVSNSIWLFHRDIFSREFLTNQTNKEIKFCISPNMNSMFIHSMCSLENKIISCESNEFIKNICMQSEVLEKLYNSKLFNIRLVINSMNLKYLYFTYNNKFCGVYLINHI